MIEAVCAHETAQAEALERARIDLARVSASMASADFDSFVDGLRIENDVRHLTRKILDFDREFADDLPTLVLLY